jgi:hypothetical protein
MSQSLGSSTTRDDELEVLHRQLIAFNRVRLTPSAEPDNWQAIVANDYAMRLVEGQFVEYERAAVRAHAAAAPRARGAFLDWFERLALDGPGQNDVLFPWLAEHASRDQMTWFLGQEMAGEAGFDDLLALTQVKMPQQSKLELARNYWDEVGQGHASGMHGPMLERLGKELGISHAGDWVWESLALANLMVALAANRHYAYHSIGALGVIELTAPRRATHVNAGLKRLGIVGEARRYYALHSTLDIKHSATWNREVIGPLIASDPRIARAIAEGALLRLRAGARCFERYRRELGLRTDHAEPGWAHAS